MFEQLNPPLNVFFIFGKLPVDMKKLTRAGIKYIVFVWME